MINYQVLKQFLIIQIRFQVIHIVKDQVGLLLWQNWNKSISILLMILRKMGLVVGAGLRDMDRMLIMSLIRLGFMIMGLVMEMVSN